MKILFVNEFPEGVYDWHISDLRDALSARIPHLKGKCFHGIFKIYKPGGLNPSRIVNLIWMHLFFPFVILSFRPHYVIVRTSPPCIQLTAAFWCSVFKIKTISWMMDNHPQIEIRGLKKAGIPILPLLLNILDKCLSRKIHLTIALDEAIASVCQEQAPDMKIIIHPPWPKKKPPRTIKPHSSGNSLHLIYAGNLGKWQNLQSLQRLLAVLAEKKKTHLWYLGNNFITQYKFQKIAKQSNVEFHHLSKVKDYTDLLKVYESQKINYGIVFMREDLYGLLTPSKVYGYLTFGLPVIYFGPKKTDPDIFCQNFQAGMSLSHEESPEALEKTASEILHNWPKYQKNAAKMAQSIAQKNASSLASELLPFLIESPISDLDYLAKAPASKECIAHTD